MPLIKPQSPALMTSFAFCGDHGARLVRGLRCPAARELTAADDVHVGGSAIR
jgi:hypothetical protein